MNFFDINTEGCDLRAEEELIVASFTRRLVEIAAVSGARGSGSSPTAALNAIRLPAIALDRKGIVVDVNAAAEVVFDNNIKIKDSRLFVRDLDSRNLLKEARECIWKTQLDPEIYARLLVVLCGVDEILGYAIDILERDRNAKRQTYQE